MAFPLTCSRSGQNSEVETGWVGAELECPVCGKRIIVPGSQQTTPRILKVSGEVQTNMKQGAVIRGWMCFALSILFMFVSLWSFFIYCPLLQSAFILSIAAMGQKRILGGIMLLLCTVVTVVIAPIILVGLGATRTAETVGLPCPPSVEKQIEPTTKTETAICVGTIH